MCAKALTPNIQLNADQRQRFQLTQRLIMSAQMQQALRLLQMPLQELEPFIEEQVVLNPILEMDQDDEFQDVDEFENQRDEEREVEIGIEDFEIFERLKEDFRDRDDGDEFVPAKRSIEEDKLKSYLEQSICAETTLQEQLIKEAHESFSSPSELEIAEILIGYIDSCGFLKTPLSEICRFHQFFEEEVLPVLRVIQTFEPYGIGASTIQESLLIQLRCHHKEESLAYVIVRDYYEELLHNSIPSIQKKLKCSYTEIQEAIEKDIAKLDLHPGTQYSSLISRPIIPDVTIRQENEQLIVDVERDYIPSLRLNFTYLKMLSNPSVSQETKQFIKHHFFSARWLMRNLQQRYSTLERIVQALAQRQYHFFMSPEGKLVPLTMKTLADELEVHESTIARTVSNKYLNSPRGIFPLRSFFTAKYSMEKGEDLSSATVKQTLLNLIENEDKTHPLSDEKLSILLKQKGISCARRTVAKYRLQFQIGNTQQRRRYSQSI